MNLTISERPDWNGIIVQIGGEVGFSEAPLLLERMDELFEGATSGVALDLEQMSFIASDGLGALIRIRAHADKKGKSLTLLRPQKMIRELLEKTQLTRIFRICDTIDEAVAKDE